MAVTTNNFLCNTPQKEIIMVANVKILATVSLRNIGKLPNV